MSQLIAICTYEAASHWRYRMELKVTYLCASYVWTTLGNCQGFPSRMRCDALYLT